MSEIVYVVTAWDEATGEDTILVFSAKAKAEDAWAKLDAETVFGGVARRIVRT